MTEEQMEKLFGEHAEPQCFERLLDPGDRLGERGGGPDGYPVFHVGGSALWGEMLITDLTERK